MTEATQMGEGRVALALAALFLSSMCTMGDLVISPVVANLYEVYAFEPMWLINLGITGPALVGLPFGLLTGYLCDRMDKKWIMVTGFAVFTVSSVFGIASQNIYYFVCMRLCATGIGWGITNTAALAILADMFTDEVKHAKFVGWYNAAMSVIGALLASVAGFLALGGWTHVFETYLVAVPVLLMLVAFLPPFPPKPDTAARVEEVWGESRSSAAAVARGLMGAQVDGKAAPKWWSRLAPLTVQVFFVAMLYFMIFYMVGVFVTDKQLGDEAFVGMLTSTMTIATAIGSIAFGAVYKVLRNKVYWPALAVIAAGYFVLAATDSQVMAVVTLAVVGLAWPFYFCFFYTFCTEIVPSTKAGLATSIVASANGLAMTASSQVLTYALDASTGGCAQVYPIFGCVLLGILVVSIVVQRALRIRKASM